MRSDNEDDMDPEEIDDESQLLVDVPLDVNHYFIFETV